MSKEREANVQNNGEEKKKGEHKIYLNLPAMSEKAFRNLVTRLKEDGAKFDSYNKFWYVTPDNDLNKFKSFLGLPYEFVNEKGKELRAIEAARKAEKAQEAEKPSLMGKLSQNKEAVENQTADSREQEKQPREAEQEH